MIPKFVYDNYINLYMITDSYMITNHAIKFRQHCESVIRKYCALVIL